VTLLFGFALKACHALHVAGEYLRQNLQRHAAAQTRIVVSGS
jgi:hypothetical protein